MSVIAKMRRQRAVVWKRNAVAREDGSYTYAAPIEVACRWDDGDNEYHDSQGETKFARSTMYPDQVLSIGDRAILAELDSETPDSPTDDSLMIVRFDTNPNFKATENLYTAYLI